MTPRIVIELEGGLVQAVITDGPEYQVLIVDHDIVGLDEAEIARIPALTQVDNPSGEFYLSGVATFAAPELVEAVFKADEARFLED